MSDAPTYQIEVQTGPVYDVQVTSTETAYTVEKSTGPTYQVEMQLGTGPAGNAATIEFLPAQTLPAGSPATAENMGTPTAAVVQLSIPAGHDGTGTVNSVAGVPPVDGDVPLTPGNIGAQPEGSYATAAQGALADTAVQPARKMSTAAGSGLTGGGDLSDDRDLAADFGTGAGKVAQGNDARFVGVPVTTQAAAYTLVLPDAGTIVEVNSAAAVNVTVPASTFATGQIVEVCQYGAGQVTIVAGSGVTLRSAGGLKISAQYGSASIRFRSATEAVVSGSMTT